MKYEDLFQYAELDNDAHFFFCFGQEIPFFGYPLLHLNQFKYADVDSDVCLFCSKIPFLSKFGPKNQNGLFKMEYENYPITNMLNLMVNLENCFRSN